MDPRNVQEFLAQDVYLPGYVNFKQEDQDGRAAVFLFNISEPPVARGEIVHYATPRGYHLCIAQAEYALVERLIQEDKLPELGETSLDKLRSILLTGRVKIARLDEHFRREVSLDKPVQMKLELKRVRQIGIAPKLEFNFDFANRSMWGMSISSIAPDKVIPLNMEAAR